MNLKCYYHVTSHSADGNCYLYILFSALYSLTTLVNYSPLNILNNFFIKETPNSVILIITK